MRLDAAAVWPTAEIPVARRVRRGRPPRRARARRFDGELVLLGCMLHMLGAVSGVLWWATAGVMPQVVAWAWAVAGFTAWALCRERSGGGADGAFIGEKSVDASSSIDVRTA